MGVISTKHNIIRSISYLITNGRTTHSQVFSKGKEDSNKGTVFYLQMHPFRSWTDDSRENCFESVFF